MEVEIQKVTQSSMYMYTTAIKKHAIVMQIKVKYTNNQIIATVVLYCYNEKKSNFESKRNKFSSNAAGLLRNKKVFYCYSE